MSSVPPLTRFSLSVQSSDSAVRTALAGVLSGLAPMNLDIEETSTIELVLAEALNNIVEHAYPEDDPDGDIHITCWHDVKGLHVTIKDQGKPMPDGQMPIGMDQDLDVDIMDMPEGGFGWFLIQNLAKDVTYAREGHENLLRLRIAVQQSAVCAP